MMYTYIYIRVIYKLPHFSQCPFSSSNPSSSFPCPSEAKQTRSSIRLPGSNSWLQFPVSQDVDAWRYMFWRIVLRIIISANRNLVAMKQHIITWNTYVVISAGHSCRYFLHQTSFLDLLLRIMRGGPIQFLLCWNFGLYTYPNDLYLWRDPTPQNQA